VALPLKPPLAPQLARPRKSLPEGEDWAYEPKLDGFRAIAFVDGETLHLQSRGGKALHRYFPEVTFTPGRYVIDGELVIPGEGGGEQFDLLQQRIHPAASRIARLAEETPARFMAFDLLARDRAKWLGRPFAERRSGLEELAREAELQLISFTADASEAEAWLRSAEGVIAKDLAAPYRPGERAGMVKVKRVRTIDCVVMGWRPGKQDGTVGSVILGLYDEGGGLRVVGHSSGFKAHEKRSLVGELAPYETGGRGTGEPSRWNNERELEWIELRPELVVEVTFDHASDGRIRHGAKVQRWRDDKPPAECRMEQLAS
jgi:ATP-dependent DNA ligase